MPEPLLFPLHFTAPLNHDERGMVLDFLAQVEKIAALKDGPAPRQPVMSA